MSRAQTTLQAALNRADELAGAGRYFDAHEAIEAFWMESSGAEKILLQGLIQVAAGLHRLARDPVNTNGSSYLLDRGLAKIETMKLLLVPRTFAAFKRSLDMIRTSGQAPKSFKFGLKGAAR